MKDRKPNTLTKAERELWRRLIMTIPEEAFSDILTPEERRRMEAVRRDRVPEEPEA